MPYPPERTANLVGPRRQAITPLVVIAACLAAVTSACSPRQPAATPPPSQAATTAAPAAAAGPAPGQGLAGTNWRLVEFQSMDDAAGTTKPSDPSVYTMQLSADGTVSMRLNCNRATGSWTAEAASDATSGTFQFGPLASTRALCPPPSMDELVLTQAEFVRGYLIRDGRLHLSLMADGGILSWEPIPPAPTP